MLASFIVFFIWTITYVCNPVWYYYFNSHF